MAITERTLRIIRKLFPDVHIARVSEQLGHELPDLERVQFAVLKLSEGRLDRLDEAIREAKVDWRDSLMAAGFGNDVKEHLRWAEGFLDS